MYGIPKSNGLSSLKLTNFSGVGATSTKIARYTTILENEGSDISYQDSADSGCIVQLLTPGIYAFSIVQDTVLGSYTPDDMIGVSINATDVEQAAGIETVDPSRRVFYSRNSHDTTDVSIAGAGCCSATVVAKAGDIIRPHLGTYSRPASGTNLSRLIVVKVAN